MTEEVIEQNPTENALQTEQVAATEPVVEAIETPVEVPVEPVETETIEQEDKRKNPWFLKRISAEAEARRLAEQRASDAEAMLERLQAGKDKDPVPPPAQDIDRLVNTRAAALRLTDDRNALVQAGQSKFGTSEFNQAAEIAAACGCVSDDFVADVLAVDRSKAHEIYMMLASEPDRATQIAQMDSRRRIAELTRMTMASPATTAAPAPAAKAPVSAKQVSKAPAPPPPVEPSASKTVPWYSDEASDAEFDKGFYSSDRLKKRQRL